MSTASRGLVRARLIAVAVMTATLLAAVALAAIPAQAAGTGTISGTVTGPVGQALTGVNVSVYKPDGSGWAVAASADTVGGSYTLQGLDAANDYRLGFFDTTGTYAGEFWQNQPTVDAAESFAVGASTPVVRNAELGVGHHITGTVTGPGSTPLQGVEVSAYPSQATNGERVVVEFDATDDQGRFDISRLAVGSYRLGFTDRSNTYVTEYWSDQPTLESATDIIVTAQGTVAGRDAQLGVVTTPPTEDPTPTPTPTPTPPAAAAPVTNTLLPYLSGLTRVPNKLRVNTGAWSPGGVTLTYQWLASGKPIKGATGSALKLKAAQIGKRISVRVTATAPGYESGSVTSNVSKKIKPRKPAR